MHAIMRMDGPDFKMILHVMIATAPRLTQCLNATLVTSVAVVLAASLMQSCGITGDRNRVFSRVFSSFVRSFSYTLTWIEGE